MGIAHPPYRYLEHTADQGLEAWGKNFQELFTNAAYGMLDIILNRSKAFKKRAINISLNADNIELLLVKWLSEVNYITHNFIPVEIEIKSISNKLLNADLWGEAYNVQRHQILTEIKNVTYHQLLVEKLPDNHYHAKVIFDL
ncbi:archease [bacterium]|nr:archease [bacterium]